MIVWTFFAPELIKDGGKAADIIKSLYSQVERMFQI